MTFTLADGSEVKRGISECHISLPQGDSHTPVILGEPGDEALLGAVTFEILGLVLDPFKRTLRVMHGTLANLKGWLHKNRPALTNIYPSGQKLAAGKEIIP